MTPAEFTGVGLLKRIGRFPPLPESEANMPVRFLRLTFREWTQVTWLLWLSLIFGLLTRILYSCKWWQYETIKSLADALIIAGIIGLSLELSAANFLIAKVGDALVGKLAGSGLPSALQRKIQEILRTSFVRDNYLKVYRLEVKDDKMVIQATISFEVRNYSEKTEEYVPAMDEEEFFAPEFLLLEYRIEGGNPFVFHDLQEKPKFEGTHTLQVEGKNKVKIGSIFSDKDAKCSVTWTYRVTMPIEFCDVIEFRYATINPKFRLERIPDGFDFTFVGDNLLPRTPDSMIWEFNSPYIAGQQVRAQWFKKSSQLVS